MLTLKEDIDAKDCKIRKRGSSSSSSSSVVRNYRLKRAILVGKRFRSSSPLLLQSKLAATLWKEEPSVEKGGDRWCNLELLHQKTETKAFDSLKSQLKEVRNMLVASKELLKALSHRICCQEQLEASTSSSLRNNNNKPIVSALRFELDRARVQLDQLIEEDRSKHHGFLLQQKAEEEERMSKAMLSMAGEIEVEKKLRRQRERLNKSLGKELADTKARLAKAVEDLQKVKRAKQVLEMKCNELTVGPNDESRAEALEELTREESARTAACEEEEEEEEDGVFNNSCRNGSQGIKDKLDEVERYKMVRDLKNHKPFGSNNVYYYSK